MTRRAAIPAALAIAFVVFAHLLHDARGAAASFSALTGFALGVVFQRSDFCFTAGVRDAVLGRRRRMGLGILSALAVGTIGYAVIFGAQLPDPTGAHVPPLAAIAPAGWHLVLGGLAFGAGMIVAGHCFTSAFFRTGEGSVAGPLVLAGAFGGYLAGLQAWPFLWSRAVSMAPTLWMPHIAGYAIAVALQLAILLALALWIRKLPGDETGSGILAGRWPAWIGGAVVGLIATAAYLRTKPLGVTEELGRLARLTGAAPARLDGLDTMPGCAPSTQAGISDNGWLVLSLVWGSLCAAVAAGEFKPRLVPGVAALRGIVGGALMGFGAAISAGCTVGVLLSGIMAMSLHGWLFAASLLAGARIASKFVDRS